MRKKWFIGVAVNLGIIFTLCSSVMAIDKKNAAVAVWDLENLNPENPAAADMGELLSAKVIETFEESGDYSIVERERLLLALEELNIGTSSLVSHSTRLQVGRIVGARLMVFGSYFVINNSMRLDLRIVEVETGNVLNAASKATSRLDPIEWLKITREVAEELLLIKPPDK